VRPEHLGGRAERDRYVVVALSPREGLSVSLARRLIATLALTFNTQHLRVVFRDDVDATLVRCAPADDLVAGRRQVAAHGVDNVVFGQHRMSVVVASITPGVGTR